MDHRAFVASVEPALREELTKKSDLPGLVHFSVHAGLIAALAALILKGVPGWPLLMVPQGILIVFLFTLLHETVHHTPFRTPWLNNAVGWFCSLALALPPNWFRYFHFAHHRHTQDPEHDPELAFPKPDTLRGYVVHVSGLPLWKGHFTTLFTNARGKCADSFVPPKGRDAIRREAILLLGIYALIAAASFAAGSAALLWVWIVPALLGQPFLRLYLLAEHGRCPLVANMLQNSNSIATTWVIRKLAWNMPYHAEHHAWPGVPYHRLPALNQVLDAYLGSKVGGYVRFHRSYLTGLGKQLKAADDLH